MGAYRRTNGDWAYVWEEEVDVTGSSGGVITSSTEIELTEQELIEMLNKIGKEKSKYYTGYIQKVRK